MLKWLCLLIGLLVCLTCASLSASELPRLLTHKEFSCTDLIDATNYYIGLGEKAALAECLEISRRAENVDLVTTYFDRVERLTWLCRMLYQANQGAFLRPPMLGALSLPIADMPKEQWPYYPLCRSGDVFFVMAEGYALSGVAERLHDYIRYCQLHAKFRTKKLRPVSRALAQESLNQLYARKSVLNKNWLSAELKHVRDFMQAQIDRMPEKIALDQSVDVDLLVLRYRELKRVTEKPVIVNLELAQLCRGVFPEDIQKARKENGPHAYSSIHVYMNELVSVAFEQKKKPYPVGAVLIKEKYLYAKGENGIGGMIKREPGYHTGHGDWEYFYVEGRGDIEQGKIESCVQCHKQARQRDYVFGEWAGRTNE